VVMGNEEGGDGEMKSHTSRRNSLFGLKTSKVFLFFMVLQVFLLGRDYFYFISTQWHGDDDADDSMAILLVSFFCVCG